MTPSQAIQKAKENMELKARKIVIELFSRVIMKSPVDSGRFRANWMLAEGQPDLTVTDSADPGPSTPDGSGPSSTKEVMVGAISVTPFDGRKLFLTNSLPYARKLEYGGYPNPPKLGSKKRGETGPTIHVIGGYSMQAPQGMVRLSIAEVVEHYNK